MQLHFLLTSTITTDDAIPVQCHHRRNARTSNPRRRCLHHLSPLPCTRALSSLPRKPQRNIPDLPIPPPFFNPNTPFFESNLASSDNLPTATGFKPPFVPRQQRRLRCKKAKGLKIAPPIFEEGVYEIGDRREFGGLETKVPKVEVARDLCTGLLRIGEVLRDREWMERVAQEERVWWVVDRSPKRESGKAEKKDMGEHWEEYFTGW